MSVAFDIFCSPFIFPLLDLQSESEQNWRKNPWKMELDIENQLVCF